MSQTVILLIILAASARLASSLLAPMAVAILVMFLFRPVVRWLQDRRISEGIGAGIVIFGTVGVLAIGIAGLKGPASKWIRDAPATVAKVESKLRTLAQPLIGLTGGTAAADSQNSARPAAAPSQVGGSRTDLLTAIGGTTADGVAAIVTVVFLSFFLLASGDLARDKLARLGGTAARQKQLTQTFVEIERQMSRYLFFTAIIGLFKGVATWGLLLAVGLPNPVLWGAVAFALNAIPYVGAVITLVLITAAALVSLDNTDKILLAGGGFSVIMMIEGNLITPLVLGHKMPLNAVAVFVCLLFWGWAWGVTGAVIAVPITVMIQILCSHIPRWQRVAVLLDR